MNVASYLATTIFAVTLLTVIGGVFAYGVYKARERSRRKVAGAAPAKAREPLEFFVEYVLPHTVRPPSEDVVAAPRTDTRLATVLFFVVVLVLGGAAFALLRLRP
jgi:hypothetical protein